MPNAQLLVTTAREQTVEALVDGLADHGIISDVVESLEDARQAFLAQGGHSLLVLGPDLTPAIAKRVLDSLTSVDPRLPVVVFGDDLFRGVTRDNLRRVHFHPSSRAAIGAVLKALHSL